MLPVSESKPFSYSRLREAVGCVQSTGFGSFFLHDRVPVKSAPCNHQKIA